MARWSLHSEIDPPPVSRCEVYKTVGVSMAELHGAACECAAQRDVTPGCMAQWCAAQFGTVLYRAGVQSGTGCTTQRRGECYVQHRTVGTDALLFQCSLSYFTKLLGPSATCLHP